MTEIFDNIRQIYTFSGPCEELAGYVEFFSESSFEETNRHIGNECFTVKMFPSWTPTIYLNLGTPYQLSAGNTLTYINSDDDVLLLRNNIVERHNLPGDHIFTIKFFPGGLEAILGINQQYIIDKVISASTVIPAALLAEIKQSPNFSARVEKLQQYFLLKLHRAKKKTHYVQLVHDVITLYASGNMHHNNSQLADKLFTTSKTINRCFNNVIGTTPKNYLAILRARTALTEYVADKNNFDPTLLGYYDHSHFYKDVIKFTGQKLSSCAC
ncbi:MAG TPA: helix-turn-helix domain-containing protein [Chitinophagaceae bacterium]|nr:helix-turn-helix domain-containing protein [Chitinophagaceae bacterium]